MVCAGAATAGVLICLTPVTLNLMVVHGATM